MALPFRSALPSEAIATPTDKSVCYSGPASPGQTTNRRKAFDYARLQDLVLIDMTPAGNWLDRRPGKTGGYAAFEADLMLPQIAEIILIKKPLIDAETKLRKKPFPGVGRERGATHPAHAVLLATNHKTVEVKVAPIECDLEQLVQHGDAAVAGHVQTPPYRRVDLEEQDVELVNFGRSVWLDHIDQDHVVAHFSPWFFPVT